MELSDEEMAGALVSAARKLLKTHGSLDEAAEALDKERKAWAKQVRDAKAAFVKALREQQLDGTETQNQRDAYDKIVGHFKDVVRAKQHREEWSAKHGKAEEDMHESIEAAAPGKCAALGEIAAAYQSLQEMEAGRKAALSQLLTDLEELNAKLKKQVHGAQQLGLFD
jgi:membrane-bound lytic murein transglycosylase